MADNFAGSGVPLTLAGMPLRFFVNNRVLSRTQSGSDSCSVSNPNAAGVANDSKAPRSLVATAVRLRVPRSQETEGALRGPSEALGLPRNSTVPPLSSLQVSALAAAVETIPPFLESVGLIDEPTVFTWYGGSGGSVHFSKTDDGATPLPWSDGIRDRILAESERMSCTGRQLGFVAVRGGSRKAQLTTGSALRAESDTLSIVDQWKVVEAFEARHVCQLTVLSTGGKSLHIWLRVADLIAAEDYTVASRAFFRLLQEAAAGAGLGVVEFDDAMSRPTQPARLPGAVHTRTGAVAEVSRWGGAVAVPLLDLGIDIERERATQTPPPSARTRAFADVSSAGFLGYVGDAEIDCLIHLAVCFPIRQPGGGTYAVVEPLVGALSRAYEPQVAAMVLHRAGHVGKNGDAGLEALRAWAETYSYDREAGIRGLAYLAGKASREYGYSRPVIRFADPEGEAQAVEPAQLLPMMLAGGGTFRAATGAGKTVAAAAAVKAMAEQWTDGPLAVTIVTPRKALNLAAAYAFGAANVSGSRGPTAQMPLLLSGVTQPGRHACCIQSLGRSSKGNGVPINTRGGNNWIERTKGPDESVAVRGAHSHVLILDEVRQIVESVTLARAEDGGMWTPQSRIEAFQALFLTLRHAGVIWALDAQAGEPERQLLLAAGRAREANNIITTPGRPREGAYRWTGSIPTFRRALCDVVRSPRERPVLAVVGAKGTEGDEEGEGTNARDLRAAVLEACPGARVKILDAESIGDDESLAILQGIGLEAWDLVIGTGVIQTGVSWVGLFHPTVFVAGGPTMAPPIAGSQAVNRERTASNAIAYLPETVPLRGLEGGTAVEIETRFREERTAGAGSAVAGAGAIVETFEKIAAAYHARAYWEAVLYRDQALDYARRDGWQVEALEEAGSKGTRGQQRRRVEALGIEALGQWPRWICERLQGLEGTFYRQRWEAYVSGAVGLDLLGNPEAVWAHLAAAGLPGLCDGEWHPAKEVAAVGGLLGTAEGRALFAQAEGWLGTTLRPGKASAAQPARAVGSILKAVGFRLTRKAVRVAGGMSKAYRVEMACCTRSFPSL